MLIVASLTGIFLYNLQTTHHSAHKQLTDQTKINDITVNQSSKDAVIEKPITGQYADQINKSQQYLVANLGKVGPFERLLLDYLQRAFSLNTQFNGSVKAISPPVKGDGEDPLQFKVLRRIAYPNQLVDKLPDTKDDSISQMIMEATYCDRIKLSSDFAQLIDSNIKAGGYNMTHVEFSLHLMQDNKCAYFSYQEDQQVRDQIAPLMIELINHTDTKPDLRYESIAYLMDMGRRDLIQDNWIKQIALEQQADGSWDLEKNVKDANGHTTILAIWALLEYSNTNLPYTPMIRH